MNPFKFKQPVKNKLVNRFNTSMSTRTETDQAHRLNSSKQTDQNIIRYRNHITFLEYRIQQQQATIQKLNQQIDNNVNHQAKLNAQIIRLQRENKNMLNHVYNVENKITDLEEQHNYQMLQQSIQKIDYELNMSHVKKRNRTLENLQNPEKSKRSIKYVDKLSIQNDQLSIKQQTTRTLFNFSSKIFQIVIKPTQTTHTNATSSISHQDLRLLQQNLQKKQSDLSIKNNKISKLQQAIYYLKKQSNDKQRQYQQQLKNYKNEQAKETENLLLDMQILKQSSKNKQKQLNEKIKYLEREIEDKEEQIIETQQKYSVQLKQAQRLMFGLNEQIQSIMKKNQEQIGKLYLLGQTYKQQVVNVQKQKNILKDNLRVIEERLHIKSSDLIIMENQLNQIAKIKTQNQQLKQKLKHKQNQIDSMNQKLQNIQKQINKTDQRMTQTKSSQKNQSEETIILKIKQEYECQIVTMKTQLQRKDSKIQEEQKKYLALGRRISELEQSYEKISKKQNVLCSNLAKITKQVEELQQIKQNQLRQINKLNSSIRNCEGQIAQKDYIVNCMTQQMLLIKQKFEIQKVEAEIQCQSALQQNKDQQQHINMEQLHEHFSTILRQKQDEHSQLCFDLQKQKGTCEQLEREMQNSIKQIQKYEIQLQAANHRIEQLEQSLSRYENQLSDHRDQIKQMKKTIHDLEQRQAFFQDYINNAKSVQT